jgi:micrococcal nuclease
MMHKAKDFGKPRWMIALLLVGLLLSTGMSGCDRRVDADPSLEGMEQVTVKRVVDGDTFITNDGQRVRLIGIDAPESVKPDTPAEPFGPEASAYVKELMEGKVVFMDQDVSETDRFNRLLRYVYLPDGTFINELILEEGYAEHVVFPPDVEHRFQLKQAEDRARKARIGLWSVLAN